MGDVTEEIQHNLHILGALLEDVIGPDTLTASPQEISKAQLSALRFVRNNPGVTPGVVAAALGIRAPSATALLQRLESRGLVKKKAAAHDHRALQLELTSAGQAALAAVEQSYRRQLAELIDHMPAAEQVKLQEGLAALLAVAGRTVGRRKMCLHCGLRHTDACILAGPKCGY